MEAGSCKLRVASFTAGARFVCVGGEALLAVTVGDRACPLMQIADCDR